VDRLVRELRDSERMPGVERIWLPGEQSHERRSQYERDGIPLAPALMAQLDKVALELGVPALTATVIPA
jgi:L-2-hydroxycarboxylate dehydrogenase (NAD+)